MSVVEAYVGGKRLNPSSDIKVLASDVSSILIEGIARNTMGSVFSSEVSISSQKIGLDLRKFQLLGRT